MKSSAAGHPPAPTRAVLASHLDGAPIEVFSLGQGPGVALVEGGGTDATTYRWLADRLGEHFTVHVYNRRGRGGSADRPAEYTLATEVADLGTVLAETGSTRLVGHSVGGFFALAGAQQLPVERLALFDPAVSVDGSLPSDFLPDFEQAVADGDAFAAMLIAGRGLRNPGWQLPMTIQRAAVRAVLLTPPGKTMARLIATVPAESRLAAEADGPADRWAAVTARTRFFIGARSPSYYAPTARLLARAMPHADVELIPRLGHDALARATRPVIESLTRFLR